MKLKRLKHLFPVILSAFIFMLASVCCFFALSGFQTTDKKITSAIKAVSSEPSHRTVWKNATVYSGVSLDTPALINSKDNEFVTPEGFKIISYSEKWKGSKLYEIYQELLNNAHGKEFEYLRSVIVYPQKEKSTDYSVLGAQQNVKNNFNLNVQMPALADLSMQYTVNTNASDILLYGMDNYNTITEAARTIAHEYGHHFTRYYFFQNENDFKNTQYYKLRNLSPYAKAKIYTTKESYMQNYKWDVLEIAAEDYVQILGSKNAKRSHSYDDIKQILDKSFKTNTKTYSKEIKEYYRNVYPQDNIYIPLADQISGLDVYFHSFLGDSYTAGKTAYPDIKINFKKRSAYGRRYYEVTWNKLPDSANVQYTLVCYTKNGNLYTPVKTAAASQQQKAIIGTPTVRRGHYIYFWNDGITKSDKILKVYALFPDGRMIASKPYNMSF